MQPDRRVVTRVTGELDDTLTFAEAVDADEARELRDRQHGHLAVAEQHPRESAEHRATTVLGGHPCGWRQREPHHPESGDEAAGTHRRQGGKRPLIDAKENNPHHRHRRGNPPERLDDLTGPVEGAREVDDPGDKPQMEGTDRTDTRDPVGTTVPAGQRNEQGYKGNPGKDRMSELREAEDEEQARGDRETHMTVMSVARAAREMRAVG